ncbi:hypothetical protein FA15DRAFT_669304 [Coprinopsis marcescibilis]|uniref:Uncharacterized protein n=1 Tax=Coprinopsis marcescibilis TaxID=230819 RepID=A0A5C3KX35_COPMA|nr:hypothetical protein FA15DRAFT_669304 [Coprinopsis marcescibilis]
MDTRTCERCPDEAYCPSQAPADLGGCASEGKDNGMVINLFTAVVALRSIGFTSDLRLFLRSTGQLLMARRGCA